MRTDSLAEEISMAQIKQHYMSKDIENYIVVNYIAQNIRVIGMIREGFLWKVGTPARL